VAAGSGEEDPQPETYLLRHYYEVIFSGPVKGGLAYWLVLQHFDLQSDGRGLPTVKNPRAGNLSTASNAFTCGSDVVFVLCYDELIGHSFLLLLGNSIY
jgi:hypothetical protein